MEFLGSGWDVVLKRELDKFKWNPEAGATPLKVKQSKRDEFNLM